MKNTSFRALALSLLAAFAIALPSLTFAYVANAVEASEMEPRFEKIYVDAEQVHVIPEGIFFVSAENEWIAARLVSVDAQGIYVVAASYRCPGCGRWNGNNTCGNSDCPLYGL